MYKLFHFVLVDNYTRKIYDYRQYCDPASVDFFVRYQLPAVMKCSVVSFRAVD